MRAALVAALALALWACATPGPTATPPTYTDLSQAFVAGCAVVISHDRWFLDRLATHILAFEGDSHVEWFEGNFESYEEDKKRRLGDAAVEPHRIKFKRFERG